MVRGGLRILRPGSLGRLVVSFGNDVSNVLGGEEAGSVAEMRVLTPFICWREMSFVRFCSRVKIGPSIGMRRSRVKSEDIGTDRDDASGGGGSRRGTGPEGL